MADLLQFLQHIDKAVFYWVNTHLANSYLDYIMVWVTRKQNWYFPGGVLWVLLMWKGGKKGRFLGLLVIAGIILADQISSSILKPFVGRLRPCKVLDDFRLLVHCGGKYSFPSSHASNIAAIGSLFIGFYRKWMPIWVILIFVIGISRIYVGVHYPFDVLGGWLLGVMIGWLLITFSRRCGFLEDQL